jgi:acetyl-CoA acetyltransferase
MNDVVIASAARTAIGSYGKSLAAVAPSELGAIATVAAMERAGIEPSDVEHVVFGNVIHTEPGDVYMARVVGIKAGIPKEVPAYTVNRLCGTGVQAIVSATQAIQTGEASVAVAGGAESMSRGPYWMPSARWGARMGEAELVDPVMGALTDPFHSILMGVTARTSRSAIRSPVSVRTSSRWTPIGGPPPLAERAGSAPRSCRCRSGSSGRRSSLLRMSTFAPTPRRSRWPSWGRCSSPAGR